MLTGFANSPISKGILICTTISSLCFSVAQQKYQLHLDLIPHLSLYHQYWRLLVHQLAFTDSSQLFLSTIILYRVSVTVERLFGTRKFAAFLSLQILFQTLLLSFLLPLIVFTPLSYPLSYLLPKQLVESGKISSGPFGLIFSILFQYARLVPDTWSIRIGSNFWLGERWTVWILALLLFFSHPKETILPSLLGIVFSKLYSSNSTFFSFLRKFRLPQVIYSTLSYLLLPLIGSTKLPSRTNFAEFPRNPTFEERRERIQGERTALERERERGGRYGLNFIRRRGSRNQEPTIPVTVTITDETQDQEAGIQSGNGNVNGTLPANARRSRRSTMFTSRGRNWVIVPPPPEGTEQGPSVEDTSRNRNDASENRSTSPNQIRAFRNYLNQITGEINTNFDETNINELQSIFPDTSRETIVQALQVCDGDHERAVDRLLSQQDEVAS